MDNGSPKPEFLAKYGDRFTKRDHRKRHNGGENNNRRSQVEQKFIRRTLDDQLFKKKFDRVGNRLAKTKRTHPVRAQPDLEPPQQPALQPNQCGNDTEQGRGNDNSFNRAYDKPGIQYRVDKL